MSVWVFQERKRRKRGRLVDVITEDMQRDDVTGGDRDRVRFPPCSLPFPALSCPAGGPYL